MLETDTTQRSLNVTDSNVPEKIRVMLVDDTRILLWDAISFLQQNPEIEIVGPICDTKNAVVQAQSCTPDVVLLDVSLKGANGLDTIADLHAFCPTVSVIVLDLLTMESVRRAAAAIGAAAVVIKPFAKTRLLPAIRAAVQGAPRKESSYAL